MPKPEGIEITSEIEIARKALKEDIKEKEKEAKERLDEILSKKRIEFCSRCGKKIDSRLDWGGKCLYEGCDNLLCNDCWIVEERRYCREHISLMQGEPEAKARKKVFFKPKPEVTREAELKPELELLRVGKREEEKKEEKIKFLTSKYINWLEERLNKFSVPDWSLKEYFKDCKFKIEKEKKEEFKVLIYTQHWFGKKLKLQIMVKPLLTEDFGYLTTQLIKETGTKVYSLVVLVGDECSLDLVNFVNSFVNPNFSLFLAEPKKGALYYNINHTQTRMYAAWFDQTREPKQFKSILKGLADIVSGRFVISVAKVSKEFGFTKEQTAKILKSCKFLSPIEGTDSSLWKEGK